MKTKLIRTVISIIMVGAFIIPASTVSAATPTLPRAWAKVKVVYGNSVTMPWGFAPNVTISLCTNLDASYCRKINSGSNELALAFSSGEFQFLNVPTGKPLGLTIINYDINGKQFRYFATYYFKYPTISTSYTLKMAGCMGKYQIDVAFGTIKYLSSSCN
jgi:hypothetical protein